MKSGPLRRPGHEVLSSDIPYQQVSLQDLSASSGLSFDKGMGCLLFCKVIQIKYNFR